MTRPDGAWLPDGRAKAIRADCEASLAALDGLPIDLYLLHAPDPRTPWATSLRGLAKLVDDGLVARIGLANVSRAQLDEALELAPIAAVQGALSPLDDSAFRSGVSSVAASVISPSWRTRRSGGRGARVGWSGSSALSSVAERHDASVAEAALAWLLALGPNVVAMPGARRPGAARSAARGSPSGARRRRAATARRVARTAAGLAPRRRPPAPRSCSSWATPGPGSPRSPRIMSPRLRAAEPRRARRDAP